MAVDASPGAGRVLIATGAGPLVAEPSWSRYDNLSMCRCFGFDWNRGRQSEFDITDTGTGVAKAIRGQIFDSFLSGRPDGTGRALGSVEAVHAVDPVDTVGVDPGAPDVPPCSSVTCVSRTSIVSSYRRTTAHLRFHPCSPATSLPRGKAGQRSDGSRQRLPRRCRDPSAQALGRAGSRRPPQVRCSLRGVEARRMIERVFEYLTVHRPSDISSSPKAERGMTSSPPTR